MLTARRRLPRVHSELLVLDGRCTVQTRGYGTGGILTTRTQDYDCLICLYWSGRYMPLVKLREHQDAMRLMPRATLLQRRDETDAEFLARAKL